MGKDEELGFKNLNYRYFRGNRRRTYKNIHGEPVKVDPKTLNQNTEIIRFLPLFHCSNIPLFHVAGIKKCH